VVDILYTALMRHCLELTHQCVVSPTAFCVGSCLFLPSSSPNYTTLAPHFDTFSIPGDSTPAGLILANGYSRQIPGNTHAEANALTNFQSRLLQLHSSADGRSLPSKEEILHHVECYATMEPCSVRTSGGPSCATELVRAGVKGVWLGVEEPPDFVQCQGVNILLEGGVQVGRVLGLEEDCLKAARRGRD
jgi:pyrimidine deaminase RibD-like protein